MNYKNYIKQPMKMFELKLNMMFFKRPHLKNSLDRSINPLIRKYRNTPFNN